VLDVRNDLTVSHDEVVQTAWATNRSAIAEEALEFFRLLYDVERDAQNLTSDGRRRLRQEMAVPIAKTLKSWLEAQRARVPDGSLRKLPACPPSPSDPQTIARPR